MRKTVWMGHSIKEDNGSGMRLSDAFPGRRFHNGVSYVITYNGVSVDETTVETITRARGAEQASPGRRARDASRTQGGAR